MSAYAQKVIDDLGPLPTHPSADPLRNPLDAFRLAIASQLSKGLELPLETVYEAVQTTSKLADFSVAFPRFKLKGKPNEHAERLAKEVSRLAIAQGSLTGRC